MENNNNDDNVVKINLQEIAEQQNQAAEDNVVKVDLSKPPGSQEEETIEDDTNIEEIIEDSADEGGESDGSDDSDTDSDDSDDSDDSSLNDDSALSEITEDDSTDSDEEEEEEEEEEEVIEDKVELPENIQKLVDFMNDTGGTIEDYTMLNKDIDSLSEDQLLREYHQNLEPTLDNDEIGFIMEDLYDTDEELDSERDIKKKTIARKRDLAKAKKHLSGLKTKYYDEIKAGSKLNPEQKKAVDFFTRYNSEQEESSKTKTQKQKVFTQKTKSLFNDEFKGFEFKVGEKRYRYNVKDAKGVMNAQADIKNFTKEYLGDDNTLKDAAGYHKALFAARNADAIADHFYKQGQADAIKNASKNSKNINMGPRKGHGKNIPNQTGLKARAVENDAPSPGKLRIKQK